MRPEIPEQVLPDMSNALAMFSAQRSGNPVAAAMAMGAPQGGGINPYALLAMTQGGGPNYLSAGVDGYPYATADDGDPRRGMFPTGASTGASGDLRSGILETAQALGMDPVDLATIISYETAGTFDPTKRGPTTQWGQHRA